MKIVIKSKQKEIVLQGDNPQETIIKTFGWLLNPIIQSTGSFETAIKTLNWNIIC